jgi:hypothetical protein
MGLDISAFSRKSSSILFYSTISVCAGAPPITMKDKTIATPEAELLKEDYG